MKADNNKNEFPLPFVATITFEVAKDLFGICESLGDGRNTPVRKIVSRVFLTIFLNLQVL